MAEPPTEDQAASARSDESHARTGERDLCLHLIESHPGLSFLLSEEGKLLFWNLTLEASTGLGPEKLTGLPLPEIFSGEQRTRVAGAIASAVRENKATVEVELQQKDGTRANYQIALQHLPLEAQPHLMGFGTDLTECKQYEASLHETRDLFDAVIQSVDAMVIGLDAQGRVNLFNEAAERITGYTQADLADRNWFEVLIPQERYPKVWKEFQRLLAGGLPKQFQNPILTKSGEERQVLWQNKGVWSPAHGACTVSVGMDITDRLRAETQVRAYRMFLEVVHRAPVGIVLLQADQSPRYLNPKFSQLFGYTLQDITGSKDWWGEAFLDPGYREAIRAEWLARVEKVLAKKAVRPMEASVHCKDGSIREVEAHITRIDHGILVIVLDVTQHRQADRALQQSEKKYRNLLESLHEGIWAIDKDDNTTFVNPLMAEMLGYGVEEMLGKSVYAFMDKQVAEDVKVNLERRRHGEKAQREMALLRKDGSPICVLLVSSPLFDAEGNYVGALAGVMDITERKKLERELKQSEERYRIVADFIYDWEYWLSPEGIFLFISPSCEVVTGYRAEEFVEDAELLVRIVHPDDAATIACHMEAIGGVVETQFILVFRIVRKDGAVRWIEHVCRPVHGRDGRYLGRRSSNRDITERHQAEEALRLEQVFSDAIINSAPGIFYVINTQGDFVRWNSEVKRLSGLSDEELRRASVLSFIHEDDKALITSKIQEVFVTGSAQAEARVMVDRDREVRNYLLTAHRFESGDSVYLAGFGVDTTGHVLAEEALRHEKAFSDLIVESSPGVFYVIDQEGSYVRWNSYLNRLTGLSDDQLSHMPGYLAVQDLDRPLWTATIKEALEKGYGQAELHLLSRERGLRTYFVTARRFNIEGAPYVVGFGLDVTERRAVARELERQASTDFLTGAIARGHFLALGEQEFVRARRYSHPFSMLMLDLDHFKAVNDTYGHHVGDITLQTLTQVCRHELRDVDILGRLGGEEFAVLMPETSEEMAFQVAERLRQSIAAAVVPLKDGPPVRFTVSIGVAILCDDDASIDALIKRADLALYEAKQTGRNKVCVAGRSKGDGPVLPPEKS